MITKIKQFFANLKQKRLQKKQLKEKIRYFRVLKAGHMFIAYILQDIKKQKQDYMNRQQRRRFERSLKQKGKFDEEMIEWYRTHRIDKVLDISKFQLEFLFMPWYKKLFNKIKSIFTRKRKEENNVQSK